MKVIILKQGTGTIPDTAQKASNHHANVPLEIYSFTL